MGEAGYTLGEARANAHDAPRRSLFGRAAGRRREDLVVGASPSTRRAVELVAAAARSQVPVLLWGPPGSGKSFLARAIHGWGRNPSSPFETVFCRALGEPPWQYRALFGSYSGPAAPGSEKGDGALARAAEGTLLLEAFEGLGPEARRALSRALEEGVYQPEGGGEPRPVRARLLLTADRRPSEPPFGSVTHQEIELAPLTERSEDILPLAAHFLATFSDQQGVAAVGFTPEARAALLAETWPGNVMELRERIRHAVRLSGAGAISAEALALGADGAGVPSFREAKRAFETRYVMGLLRRCEGNVSRAARLAKKDRKDFYDVIRRTGVDPSQFRR